MLTPEIVLAPDRRWCAGCVKRKTVWLVRFGPFCRQRVCWKCMGPELRAAFREGY